MPDPLTNRRLGRYEIHQEIGRGGMARVYRATDTLLQRQVALKILAPQYSHDPQFARRFEREAITAANLRHPAIITIFDVGESDGLRYIAMEFVAGRTLADVLQERGKLGLALTIAVLQPVAEALQYAHSQGAFHRDVKPHNILIDTDGRVLLTDFGIAVGPKAGDERLTQVGSFMGTPEYLSPEQAQGQQPGGASDIYSLGIVAWEALAGQVPFVGNAPQLIMAHVYSTPPSIRTLDGTLPPELDPVFAQALAKDPSGRFDKATSFVEALRSITHRLGMPAAARPEIAALAVPFGSSAGQATIAMQTPPELRVPPAGRPAARQQFPIGDVFGPAPAGPATPPQVSAASTTGRPAHGDPAETIADVFGAPPPRRTPAQAQRAVEAAPRGDIPRAQRPPIARRTPPRPMVYPQGDDGGYDPPPRRPRYSSGDGGRRWAALAMGLIILLLIGLLIWQSMRPRAPSAGAEENGGLAGIFAPTAVTPTAVAPTDVPPTTAPIVAPTLVPTTAPGEPTPPPTETPAPTATTPPEPTAAPTETAPPEPTATPPPTATAEPSLTAEPTETAEPQATPEPPASPTAPPSGPTAVGGGTGLVFQAGDALNSFDTASGRGRQISSGAEPVGPAAIAPDGSAIVFDGEGEAGRDLFLYDRDSGAVGELITAEGDQYHPAWSTDGSQLVFASTENGSPEIYRADPRGARLVRLTNDEDSEDDYPSFTPDGQQIVWESLRDGHWEIWITSQDEARRLVRPVEGSDDRYPRVSPDGQLLIFSSNRDRSDGGFELYLQQLPDGEPRRITDFGSGSALGAQWSPDGTLLVFFSDARSSGDIFVMPAAGGRPQPWGDPEDDLRWPVWGP